MNLEALRKTGFIPDIQWILESYAAGHYEQLQKIVRVLSDEWDTQVRIMEADPIKGAEICEAIGLGGLPKRCFGSSEWKKALGCFVSNEKLPIHVGKLLQSPCPFTASKTVQETHWLFYLPGNKDIQFYRDAIPHTSFKSIMIDGIDFEFPSKDLYSPDESKWVLIYSHPLSSNNGRQISVQEQFLEARYEDYELASTRECLAAFVTSNLMDPDMFTHTKCGLTKESIHIEDKTQYGDRKADDMRIIVQRTEEGVEIYSCKGSLTSIPRANVTGIWVCRKI